MDFRTRVVLSSPLSKIDHYTKIMLFGSCFAENIGHELIKHKFRVNCNPFGILYNPLSISAAIRRLLAGDPFTESGLILHNEIYHSFMHHGRFSDSDSSVCLDKISKEFEAAVEDIKKADFYLITFGTAYAYRLKESGEIVANCHKIPAGRFHHFRMSVDEIVEEWSGLITRLMHLNPEAKFIFTVSPIRHIKDGLHENQVSKSILLLSIDQLQSRFTGNVFYFPSYEIMIDDLRDYRFYDADMLHPTPFAIEYIWSLFSETYFSGEAVQINAEWTKIRKALEHIPLYPATESHRRFLMEAARELEAFASKYPRVSCSDEKQHLSKLLTS